MPETKIKIDKPWFVYIILCDDGTLYTGITLDLSRRLTMHQSGKGARYTRTHGAKEIVFSEQLISHKEAMLREIQIKKLPRKEKVKLYT